VIDLAESYERCRLLRRAHGRTYYLATRLLPAWKRRHVHALYGFMRHTDDLVDTLDRDRAARLRAWTARVDAALRGDTGGDPVLPALVHTVAVFQLDPADIAAFLRSMALDLAVTAYDTYDDLLNYMEGSAAAVGTLMLPILGATDPVRAREPARQLGLAFQLTNFIRDIREDAHLGRVYLPRKDLAEFGVDPEELRAGRMTEAVRALVAFEVARAREHYARAAPGIPMLAPSARPCIRAAIHLYGGILDEVVNANYDVFARRATVPNRRRLAIAARCLLTPPGRPVEVSR
jgi:15-cis-phytoene synthase